MGASFSPPTLIRIVLSSQFGDGTKSSQTLNVNESVPEKFREGVYVKSGIVPVMLPFSGSVSRVIVNGSPSASKPDKVISTGESSAIVNVCGYAKGVVSRELGTSVKVSGSESRMETPFKSIIPSFETRISYLSVSPGSGFLLLFSSTSNKSVLVTEISV